MKTRIEHPCVQYGKIKLDFLQVLDVKKKNFVGLTTTISKYGYWYPGYTTLSILMALEGIRVTKKVQGGYRLPFMYSSLCFPSFTL